MRKVNTASKKHDFKTVNLNPKLEKITNVTHNRLLLCKAGSENAIAFLKKYVLSVHSPKLSYHLSIGLKKPAITQKHDEAPDVVVGAGAGPGVGAADGPGGQGLSLDQPRLQQDRVEGRAALVAPPGIIKLADKPIVFEEDNKAGIKTDELGEQQRQLRGTVCSAPHLYNRYSFY